jgi:hypothetical protein
VKPHRKLLDPTVSRNQLPGVDPTRRSRVSLRPRRISVPPRS